ncbi:MAG TPA: hypothetical protein ENH38_01760 [Nitrospirae bacterium]|nr:hypothetical protein [Nitrospirota bacterium]
MSLKIRLISKIAGKITRIQGVRVLAPALYLNGGLFQKNDLDNLYIHIRDDLFEMVFNFFEKYNFAILERVDRYIDSLNTGERV